MTDVTKGNTHSGDTIDIAELAPDRRSVSRPLSELIASWNSSSWNPFKLPEEAQWVPSVGFGDRIVVFAQRSGGLAPAAGFGGWIVSVVWIQDGVVYGFHQSMNPGPTHLDQLYDASEFHENLVKFLRNRERFDRALADADLSARARSLGEFVRVEQPIERQDALEALAQGGTEAVLELRRLLDDPSVLGVHSEIITALVKAHAKDMPWSSLLRAETSYWRAECPKLIPGWWNDMRDYPKVEVPRYHYSRVLKVLEQIREGRQLEFMPDVRQFSAVWSACPPIGSAAERSQDQISQQLDALWKLNR